MNDSNSSIDSFVSVCDANPKLKWFALADAAQHPGLPSALRFANSRAKCLLCSGQSQIEAYAPHLIELPLPSVASNEWKWILRNSIKFPCVTLLAAEYEFEEIFERLSNCCEVKMPSGEIMYLAFWDPAILGTLLGQDDDYTLHVKGPVMTRKQRSWFTEKLTSWWYWDRNGCLHKTSVETTDASMQDVTLEFTQEQVDDLIEASIPDHLLYYLNTNQTKLINTILPSQRYGLVRRALLSAYDIGLNSMRDLMNFACISLIYGERLQRDIVIIDLLEKVARKEIAFSDALTLLPE